MTKNDIPIHHKLLEKAVAPLVREISGPVDSKDQIPHRHNYHLIFLFTQSGGSHSIDSHSYAIQKQTVHLLNPGQIHCFKTLEPSCGYLVAFSQDQIPIQSPLNGLVEEWFSRVGIDFSPNLSIDDGTFKALLQIIHLMSSEADKAYPMLNDVLFSYLHIFLSTCFLNISSTAKNNPNKEVMQSFLQLLSDQYKKERSSSYYSVQLGISKKKLNSLCKQYYGKSAKDLIVSHTLSESKRLLIYSSLNIAEIAFDLGFNDTANFSNFFKHHNGQAPGAYKNEHKLS